MKVDRIPIRENRKKLNQPRKKSLVQRIIQFRLVGYVVIGIGLHQLDNDINYIIFQMFLLILFTELNARGVSKKRIDKLKEELNVVQDIDYSQRDDIEHKGLLAQEQKDRELASKDIEENYNP